MAESVITSYFPSQVASDAEKMSMDYGTTVGRAIESEWFNNTMEVIAVGFKATKLLFTI